MSLTSRRLAFALRVLALALVLLFLAAPLSTEETAWGIWPSTYLPAAWRWGLALAAAFLITAGGRLPNFIGSLHFARVGARSDAVLSGPSHFMFVASRVSRPNARRLLRLSLALACAVPFYAFRIVHTRWGDAFMLIANISHPQVRVTYNWMAPLDVFLHAKTFAAGQALFGWADATPAYWLLSTAAGVAFVWTLLGFAAWAGRDRLEAALLAALVLSLGTMQLFFGYIENYTLMALGMLVYFWLALRTLRGEISIAWPALALAVTNGLAPSSLVLGPSLLYLWWRKTPRWPNLLAAAAPYALVMLGVTALMTAGGHGLNVFLGAEAPGGGDHRWLVPLAATATRWEHYTMFSLGHLRDIANEQLLSAPAILPALLLIAALAWPRVRTAFSPASPLTPDAARLTADASSLAHHELWFLLIATISYLFLTLVWNPDYGGQRDWDLFAPAAIPAALLLARLLPRALPERPALKAAGWALVTGQALHTIAWIYQNTLPWNWK